MEKREKRCMDSKEFLELVMKKMIESDLDRITRVQIKNLEIINRAAKECLENLGKEHDNIKTREVKETLESEMNRLAKTIMENDEEYKRLKEEIKKGEKK